MSEEHGQIVAHYTSAEALLKILDTKALWASDARYLNDTAEVIEGVNLADSRLALRFNGVDHADLPYLEHMKKEAADAFTFSLPLVACFSRDIDSLAQWRGYGNHSVAVALEFDEDELRALLESKHAILADCLYKEDRQVALLDDVIEQTLTTLRRKGVVPRLDEIGRWVKHKYMERKYPEKAEFLRQVREAQTTEKLVAHVPYPPVAHTKFIYSLMQALPRIKHRSFEREFEVRAINVTDEATDDLQFRVSGQSIIPYRLLPIQAHDGTTPLRRVRIGPGVSFDLNGPAVDRLLWSKDFYRVDVVKSDCTLRM